MRGDVADELADAQRQRVAVIGRRGEGDDAAAVPALDERIVVQGEVDPSRPGAADVALVHVLSAGNTRLPSSSVLRATARMISGEVSAVSS